MKHLSVCCSSGVFPLCGVEEKRPEMSDKLGEVDCRECLGKVGWDQVLSSLENEELLRLDAAWARTFEAWQASAKLERELWLEFASWAVRADQCPPDVLGRYLQTVSETTRLFDEQQKAQRELGKLVAKLKNRPQEAPSSENREPSP